MNYKIEWYYDYLGAMNPDGRTFHEQHVNRIEAKHTLQAFELVEKQHQLDTEFTMEVLKPNTRRYVRKPTSKYSVDSLQVRLTPCMGNNEI